MIIQILIYSAIAVLSATFGFFACALFAGGKINRLENEAVGLKSCLTELVDIIDNGGEVDSFTTQPAGKILGLVGYENL